MDETTVTKEPQPQGIASMASDIATHLRTRYQGKKHGGYNIYEDEKIHISLDTYVPNLDIQVITPEGRETVFSAAYHNWHRPGIFRPGQWVEYLMGFGEQVERAKREAKEKRETEKREDLQKRYRPIEDAAVFGKQ